jgi:hypothetical protein
MRTVLISLPVAVTALLGCGPEHKEEAALAVPERDLTLATPAPEVAIASPVELEDRRAQPRAVQRSRPISRAAAAARPIRVQPAPVPAVQLAAPAIAANDRELPPGKTITVIPVSSGPSAAPGNEVPEMGDRRIGKRCPPRRRPGIGIAARPKPVLY